MAVTYKGLAATFRTPGLASTAHNIFSIFNTTGSAIYVNLKALSLVVEDTGALATLAPNWRCSRLTTAPTGGTSLTKVPGDTLLSSAANVEVRGAASADGTASAGAIVATLGTAAWGGFKMRQATAVGQILYPESSCLPPDAATAPLILRASEGYLLQMVTASVTTASYLVNVAWEEAN